MCPWTFPKVEWTINPHMHRDNQPDPEKARLEWHMLLDCYLQLGIKVELLAPVPGLHDMVYTANAGWGKNGAFILSNFKHAERKKETEHHRQWFLNQNFPFVQQARGHFEGQGDLITTNSAYLLGYGTRTSLDFGDELKHALTLDNPLIQLELVDPAFYHLDTCLFSWRTINVVMYYPGAFTNEGISKLKQLPLTLIEVTRKEALTFVCNSVYYKKTALLSGASERLLRLFRNMGCHTSVITSAQDIATFFTSYNTNGNVPTVISLPVPTELMKGGGSYRCCSLFLD